VARFLAEQVFTGVPGASASLSPPVKADLPAFTMPFLSGGFGTPDLFGNIEKRHWFFLSDVAGLGKGLTTALTADILIAILLIPLTAYVLWHTAFGLRLRSCGERPSAADSLGVPVYLMKYIAVLISSALAGLGGASLVIFSTRYREGQTANRGFLGLAAMIFGNWRPWGTAAGALLFGYADSLQLRSADSVRGLFLFAAIVFAGFGVLQAIHGKYGSAGALIVLSALSYWYYNSHTTVPNQVVFMTPYVVTLAVLAFASQNLRPPMADGIVWRKGDVA
jgi:simple sugar transport system permease protein